MSRLDNALKFRSPCYEEKKHYVSPEQYGLPATSAKLRLSPLDMNMPRLYGTRWILCFPLSANVDKAQVYENLKLGLAHTIHAIPWIAGNVGPEERHDPKHNRIQIVDGSGGVELRYKDLCGIMPTYMELRSEHFPLSKLSTAQLSPVGVMPGRHQPVMAAQANFIEGGLLLAVAVHHSASDGLGADTIIDTWASNSAAACGSGSFIVHDSHSDDRSALMVVTQGAALADFPEYVLVPTPPATTTDVNTHQMAATPFKLPPMTSHIFHFSEKSLADLKSLANAHSTNDALSAFLWRHMTLGRNPAGTSTFDPVGNPNTSALLYAINIRNRTSPPLSPTYFGNASMASITKRLSVTTLVGETGLKCAAAAIRTSLAIFNQPNRVPLTIGLIDSRPDPTDHKFAYSGFLGPDISTTSWADFGIYKYEWGILGQAESFRIPGEGADGVVAVFPRLKGGALEVMVGLEDGAMERMMKNEEFTKFAELWA